MANASSDQVAKAVEGFYHERGGSDSQVIDSWSPAEVLRAADEYASKNAPSGMTAAQKKNFVDRVIKGAAQVKTNCNEYNRLRAAYEKVTDNGTKKVVSANGQEIQPPKFTPYKNVEGDTTNLTPIKNQYADTAKSADTDNPAKATDAEVKKAVDGYLASKYADQDGKLDPRKVAEINLNDQNERQAFHDYLEQNLPSGEFDAIDFVGRADEAMEQSKQVADDFNKAKNEAAHQDLIDGGDRASKMQYDPSKGIDYSKGGRETPPTQDQAADTSTQVNPSSQDIAPSDQSTDDSGGDDVTDFEAVGIRDGRRLAVIQASDVNKKLPEVKDSFKGKTLADKINFEATYIISQQRNGKASLEKQGYVNRIVPSYDDKSFLDQVVEMAFETSGMGSYETQLAQVFARHDRFKRSLANKNSVLSGFTFFTRPCLCLTDWNLAPHRKLAHLITTDVNAMPFAIKCLLDTKFAKKNKLAGECPLVDTGNPFLIPLCNAVRSMSGFIDPMLITETTEGGFFSEDQTYVIGGDRMSRTYDINCTFRDYPGNPILTIIDDWCEYMAGLTDGSLQQYASAIDYNRMDYTVSIYRFLMDRTNRYIVRWAKCTGCYPVSPPTGIAMNLNEGEELVQAAGELAVVFKANRIEYDDPIILKEFNMLVRRYATDAGIKENNMNAFAHNVASNNFCGVPYIRPTTRGYELLWLARKGKVGELFSGAEVKLDAPTFKDSSNNSDLDSNIL